MSRLSRAERRQEMFSLVERWEQSSQTQGDFCSSEGLSLTVFSYWLRKYRLENEQSSPSEFIPLSPIEDRDGTMIELEYPNGIRLRVPSGTSADFIGQLIHVC